MYEIYKLRMRHFNTEQIGNITELQPDLEIIHIRIQGIFLPPNNSLVELDKETTEATSINCFKSCLH